MFTDQNRRFLDTPPRPHCYYGPSYQKSIRRYYMIVIMYNICMSWSRKFRQRPVLDMIKYESNWANHLYGIFKRIIGTNGFVFSNDLSRRYNDVPCMGQLNTHNRTLNLPSSFSNSRITLNLHRCLSRSWSPIQIGPFYLFFPLRRKQ